MNHKSQQKSRFFFSIRVTTTSVNAQATEIKRAKPKIGFERNWFSNIGAVPDRERDRLIESAGWVELLERARETAELRMPERAGDPARRERQPRGDEKSEALCGYFSEKGILVIIIIIIF